MSFWKHEPPNPTLACSHKIVKSNNLTIIRKKPTWRNLGPILESRPIAWATSDTSAPVASHTADMLLMLEIRWARNALAASLLSSLDLSRTRKDLFGLGLVDWLRRTAKLTRCSW